MDDIKAPGRPDPLSTHCSREKFDIASEMIHNLVDFVEQNIENATEDGL